MRTLSTTLAAAVSATGRQPSVQCRLADDKLRFATFRQDATAKAVDGCAACVAPDGSLVRAALFENGGAGNADLAVQRITDPTQASQWTTWTTLVSANAEATSNLALSVNTGNIIRLFYADGPSAAATINVFESTTNGASWTGPSTVYAGTHSHFYLASAGNDDLFALRETTLGNWDVRFFRKVAGVWQAPVTWSIGTFAFMAGIAATISAGVYYLAVSETALTGVDTPFIEAYSFDGVSTWTDLATIAPVDGANLGLQFRYPNLLNADGLFTLTFTAHDDGSISGAVTDRYLLSRSLDFTHWSAGLPVSPFSLTTNTGAPLVKAFSTYYATTPTSTFSWAVYTAGDATRNTDASAQLLSYERHEALLRPGQVKVTLSNQNGQYNSSGGGVPGLVKNATLILDEGYITVNSTEQVQVANALVEHWYYQRSPGENELVIVALDQSRWLDYEATSLLTYTNRTVIWLALEICARAGIFQVFWPGTSAINQAVASFAIQPGQTWRTALHRLVDAYALEYVVRADGSLVLHDPSELTYQFTIAGDSPSAWWRLDETSGTSAADSSGHAHTATIHGAVALGAASATTDPDPAMTFTN